MGRDERATDFSEHLYGQLEVVLTQHLSSIVGTVTDAEGRPGSMAWVTLTGAGRASLHAWSMTSDVTQADGRGWFAITMPPGEYRVNAVSTPTFASREAAREGMSRITFGGVAVSLGERETKVTPVILQTR